MSEIPVVFWFLYFSSSSSNFSVLHRWLLHFGFLLWNYLVKKLFVPGWRNLYYFIWLALHIFKDFFSASLKRLGFFVFFLNECVLVVGYELLIWSIISCAVDDDTFFLDQFSYSSLELVVVIWRILDWPLVTVFELFVYRTAFWKIIPQINFHLPFIYRK